MRDRERKTSDRQTDRKSETEREREMRVMNTGII